MKKSKTETKSAYDLITERILEALDQGIVPWRKSWSLSAGVRPQSIVGRAYSGINALVLGLSGYSDPRWLTYKKAGELGGNVLKGEKGTPIVFWKKMSREDENEAGEKVIKPFMMLRYYTVFNVEQCEGLDVAPFQVKEVKEFDAIAEAEKIIDGMPNPPSIDHNGGDRAFYIPSLDQVHLPALEDFDSPEEYYSTAFHELGHSTGHESRLNRHEMETGIAPFGTPTYSKEELAAEFSAAFLCAESGIENTVDNSAAYIQGWAKKLRSDKKLVIVAASQGQKAADYILGVVKEEEEN